MRVLFSHSVRHGPRGGWEGWKTAGKNAGYKCASVRDLIVKCCFSFETRAVRFCVFSRCVCSLFVHAWWVFGTESVWLRCKIKSGGRVSENGGRECFSALVSADCDVGC